MVSPTEEIPVFDWRRATINIGFSGHLLFCGVKTGFDGLSSVVLVRFLWNFPQAPGISS
jgi:hypothetical protein